MKVNIKITDETQQGYYTKAIKKWFYDFPFSQLHNVAYSEDTVHCQGYDKQSKKMLSVIYTKKDLFN